MLKAMEKIGGATAIFLVLGAVFTLLGLLFSERDKASIANMLRAKSDLLASKNEELAHKSDELAAKIDQVASKSDEIARLTKTNADIMTGGSSFCFLNLIPGKNGRAFLLVEHRGEFPVYDVSADVVDFSEGNVSHNVSDPKIISGNRYHFSIGTVINYAGWPNEVGSLPLAEKGDLHYAVFIHARNGILTKDIKGARLDNGEWKINIHVSKFDAASKKDIVVYQT